MKSDPEYARHVRQAQILSWVHATFGPQAVKTEERVLRFLEEAIELAQAEGVPAEMVGRILQHVYSKPPGDPKLEAGGVGVTLLAYCESAGIDADEAERAEFERVRSISKEQLSQRHRLKEIAGIAIKTATNEET